MCNKGKNKFLVTDAHVLSCESWNHGQNDRTRGKNHDLSDVLGARALFLSDIRHHLQHSLTVTFTLRLVSIAQLGVLPNSATTYI